MSLSEIFSVKYTAKYTALFLVLCIGLAGCAGPGKTVPVEEEALPSLAVQSLTPDQTSPQVARRATIQWKMSASGGEGEHTYEFWLVSEKGEFLEQKGTSPVWDWSPQEAGSYQVKVIVRDGQGQAAEGSWPTPFEILAEPVVTSLLSDKTSPQTARMGSIRWTAAAQGGAGELMYEFRYTDGKEVTAVQRGPSPFFDWVPEEPGTYKIKVAVRDTMGHTVESVWSRPFEITPELLFKSLEPDRVSPQAARMAVIQWSATAEGGAGNRTYEFRQTDGTEETVVQKGLSPTWDWAPGKAGTYQIRVIVRDLLGHQVESGWSTEYVIAPELILHSMAPDKTPPQAARMTVVRWTAEASGGVGERVYEFRSVREGREEEVRHEPVEDEVPDQKARPATVEIPVKQEPLHEDAASAGEGMFTEGQEYFTIQAATLTSMDSAEKYYESLEKKLSEKEREFLRIEFVNNKYYTVRMGRFTEQEGAKEFFETVRNKVSGVIQIKAPLRKERIRKIFYPPLVSAEVSEHEAVTPADPVRDLPGAGAAKENSAESAGEQAVTVEKEDLEVMEQTGPSPTWEWKPDQEGTYRIQVVVKDAIGNRVASAWSADYRVEPELVAESLMPDKKSPQAAGMTKIRWTLRASGGVGRLTYVFKLIDGKEEAVVQEGLSPAWDWSPQKAGVYRIKVIVRDELGNSKEHEGPDAYEVAPELILQSLVPDKQGPQASGKTTIRWSVSITGGAGVLTYEFIRFDGIEEAVLQAGPSPALDWMPDKPGIYKIKVVVRDEAGNQVESGWSEEFEILTKLVPGSLVAVFPFENYNLRPVPVREIRESYLNKLKSAGLEILPQDVLEKFMARHRIRHTGGISGALSEALREETGAEGLIMTALEFYDDGPPPIIAMASRLVSAGREQEILWMKSVGLTGDDARGLLDLGRIKDPGVLQDKAEQILADSLHEYISLWKDPDPRKEEKRFFPKVAYRSPLIYPERRYTVAVVPFFNRSHRDYAGEIMTLQFVEKLRERKGFEVLDPGEVRQKLLGYRVIMYEGLSLGDADLLFEFLDVDLIVTGNVLDYQDALRGAGKPKVDFSAVMIERESREVVWSSKNYNQGDDRVFFFDWGKMRTANAMASRMVRAVVGEMVRIE